MKNQPTKLTPAQLKMKTLLKPIVEGIIKEEETPQKIKFYITESFKNIRRMMDMLELNVKNNTVDQESYEYIMDGIRKKLNQLDTNIKHLLK